jgi:hypothetical protein
MASLGQLTTDVMGWLDRRDVAALIPAWVSMTETDIKQILRVRAMVSNATQDIDAPLISLPPDFAAMAAIRDLTTGKLLALEDNWTGPLYGDGTRPTTAYRLVGDCVEFLPHPLIPNPAPAGWTPKTVRMTWFRAPTPLQKSGDSNAVLEQHYAIYLFGVCKYGAMFELDDDRAAQMTGAFTDAATSANISYESANYSGAPLRAAPALQRGF